MTDPSQIPTSPAQPATFADETGPNLAPAKPLQDAQKADPYKPIDLLELVKECRTEMRREKEKEEWRGRIMASQKNELYYKGFQRLRKADLTPSWRVLDVKPIYYTINEFQFWCNVNKYKWNSSRVDYRVGGLNDTEDAQAAASKIEWIADYYDDRDWTRTAVSKASLEAQFTGHLIAYVSFDNDYKQRQAYVPVCERVTEKIGQDVYRCADCDNVGQISDPAAPVCDSCGSDRVAVTETPQIDIEKVTGQQAVKIGDVRHELISIYNLCWKASLGLDRSPIVLWEEEHDREALESRWPTLDLPRAAAEDTALRAKASLENTGKGSTEKTTRDVLTRMWIEPSRYSRFKAKKDIETLQGDVIAEGTPYIERFPKGIHVIMIGDLIIDLYEADKHEDLCVMEYGATPNGLAQGVDAMCEPQRQRNSISSLINIGLRHTALPAVQYTQGAVDPADLGGDPSKPYGYNPAIAELYPNVTADNAVIYKQGQTIPAAAFQYNTDLRAAIQFAAHATEMSEGLPGVNNDTLGGAQIAQSLAQGIYSSYLAAFADFRVEIIKRKLLKFKRHVWDKRFFQLAGDYGIQEGQYLSGMDIPDDFEITPIPNSWAPRTPRQQQQNMQALLAAVGGPAGLATMPPAELAQMCEVFDVRFTGNEYPAAIRTARMRIKQAETLLPALQIANQAIETFTGAPPMGSPQPVSVPQPPIATPMGAVQPPPAQGMVQQPISVGEQLFEALRPPFNPRESGHGEAAEYLSKWFTTDAGLTAPEEIIEFVGVLQMAHIQAQALHNEVRQGLSGQMPPPMPGVAPAPNTAMPVGG